MAKFAARNGRGLCATTIKEEKKMKGTGKITGHLACFIAYAIFGINVIVCKDLTAGNLISPLTIFCMRSIGAGALFWLISLFLPKEKVDPKDFIKIAAASFLGYFLTQVTFLFAISHITPMDCSIISAMSPIYTMIIAAIVLKEPISLQKAGGVALSLAGMIFMIMNTASATAAGPKTEMSGVLLMIANSISFSLYLGIFKPVIQKYSVITFMKWIFLFSFLMSFPFSAKELFTLDYAALPSGIVWDLVFLILCATFITYFLIPIGQKRIRPTIVSMYSYVQPIIATAISIIIGMDVLTWQKILATITVFTGVAIVSFSRSATR